VAIDAPLVGDPMTGRQHHDGPYHQRALRASCSLRLRTQPAANRTQYRQGNVVGSTTAVDLRGRLSNPDIRDAVGQTALVLADVKIDNASTASPTSARRRRRLVDRLGEQIISDLLRDSGVGTTQRRLAERQRQREQREAPVEA
jgi:hypothetical protein